MSTTAAKPVIVIVPGAWHVPAHYAHFALYLNRLGYTVDCIDPPSTEPPETLPEDSWEADVTTIRDAISSHADAGRDVVLLMHSFGGLTGSQAAVGLGKKQGGEGGVVKLIYMTSFMVNEGWKREDFGVNETWPNVAFPDEKNPGFLKALDPTHYFYHDVPSQPLQRALDNLALLPIKHAMNSPKGAAWREIPTAYIICEEDAAITPKGQQQMIDAVKAQGVEVQVASLKASHSPFLSMPGETAKVISGLLN